MPDGFCDMAHPAALSAQIKKELADAATTESESDVQSEKLSDEALTRFYPLQTAVAANDHQGGSVIKQLLNRNAAIYNRREHSSGRGVPSASVAGRSPASGPVMSQYKISDGRCVNVGDLLISHAVAAHDVDAKAVLMWIATTGNHVTILSLLPQNRGCSKYSE